MCKRPLFKRNLISAGWLGVVLMVVGVGSYSCYPGGPLSVTETDTVTTFRQKTADFSKYKTYALPDSVLHVDRDGNAVEDPDRSSDRTILNAIDRNMQAMGFSKVADPNKADVHVLPMVTVQKWVGGGCYPSWWCGWWYCYPGWCYPVAYTYNTGTILIPMLDPSQAGGTEEVEALWLAGINGLLSKNVDTVARINARVDQAFKQSPYLKEGK